MGHHLAQQRKGKGQRAYPDLFWPSAATIEIKAEGAGGPKPHGPTDRASETRPGWLIGPDFAYALGSVDS